MHRDLLHAEGGLNPSLKKSPAGKSVSLSPSHCPRYRNTEMCAYFFFK